jgi:hypothetical protein
VSRDWLTRPTDDRTWPNAAFSLIAAIGPAAASTTPALEQIRATMNGDDPTPTELDPDDRLDAAILSVRGGTSEG